MQRRYICNEDIHATKINMQRRYICNGDIYATKIYMQQGYICNEETHLVESAADDDIAAGLDNCVGRAQLGPNLLAPNLVKICEGLCFVFWSRYVRDSVLQLPTLLPSVSTLVTRIAPKLVSSEVSPTWERSLSRCR